jgi:hypothetical protein
MKLVDVDATILSTIKIKGQKPSNINCNLINNTKKKKKKKT